MSACESDFVATVKNRSSDLRMNNGAAKGKKRKKKLYRPRSDSSPKAQIEFGEPVMRHL